MIFWLLAIFLLFPVSKGSLNFPSEKEIKPLIVQTGQSIELPCKYEEPNIKRVFWSYIKVGEKTKRFIYDMPHNQTKTNYKALCGPNRNECNLVLLQASKEHAGTYSCEIEKDAGKDAKNANIFELVVGELICNSNMKTRQFMLGENDCLGLEADLIERTCSFDYHGNPNLNLWFRWNGVYNNGLNKNEDKLPGSFISSTDGTQIVNVRDTMPVSVHMNGVTFGCSVDGYPTLGLCKLPKLKVEYVSYLAEKYKAINEDRISSITCSLNKSDNVYCSYFWEYTAKQSILKFKNSVLTKTNIKQIGLYTCYANCNLSNSVKCHIPAMMIYVETPQKRQTSPLNVGLILLIGGVISLLFLAFAILLKWNDRNECKKKPGHSKLRAKKYSMVEQSQITRYEEQFLLISKLTWSAWNSTETERFTDEIECHYCHPALKCNLAGYVRLKDILHVSEWSNPLLEKENPLECSYLNASLAACFHYEKKFDKKLISNLIYPQNKNGDTIYNSSGVYVIKLYFSGKFQKVVIDDYLPVDEKRKLLCNFSENTNDYWVSLLEKAYMKVINSFHFKDYIEQLKLPKINILTGWIPSGIAIDSNFNIEKINKEFQKGNCLICVLRRIDAQSFFILDIKEDVQHARLIVPDHNDTDHQHTGSYLSMKQPFKVNDFNIFFEKNVCSGCNEFNVMVYSYMLSAEAEYTLKVYSTAKTTITELDDLKLPYTKREMCRLGNVFNFKIWCNYGLNQAFFDLQSFHRKFRECQMKIENIVFEKTETYVRTNEVKNTNNCNLDLKNIPNGEYRITITGEYYDDKQNDCMLSVSSNCRISLFIN